MRTSLVIRSRDEAPRLRLTLASLEAQVGLDEVIVVDDASRDATGAVIAEAAARLPLVGLRNAEPLGRAGASNRGAAAATGELLLFLDGDTLAGPGMVAAHVAAHQAEAPRIGRGETWHLRCTRALGDPETATAWPGDPLGELPPAERAAARVTRDAVRHAFAGIERRARPGIYPGAAPARLHAAEMAALATRWASARAWAAASGSNLSVPRADFLRAGGFDPALDINEHRELAYRLCAAGVRIVPVPGARSYHLTHRSGWRDPLADRGWASHFAAKHPAAPLGELMCYWQALSGPAPAPDFFAAA